MRRSAQSAVAFGKFDVVGRLGVGGMGEVFRATDRTDHGRREVALKLLRADFATNTHFREMFAAEAEVGALLNHPNIVRVFERGDIDGMLYLATELVQGVSLDRILHDGSLPMEVALHVALGLLDALEHAHSLTSGAGQPLRLMHRDVSASNVLVSLEGDVKLSDFGLAKVEGMALTLTNELKGKRAYMAPEQLEGGEMDRRVDLFAMGVLLHELLTGKRPFVDVADWVKGQRELGDVPLASVITKALAIRPADRFASAGEFAQAVKRRGGAPAPDARRQLADRAAASHKAMKPFNTFDRIFLEELASNHWPEESSQHRTFERFGQVADDSPTNVRVAPPEPAEGMEEEAKTSERRWDAPRTKSERRPAPPSAGQGAVRGAGRRLAFAALGLAAVGSGIAIWLTRANEPADVTKPTSTSKPQATAKPEPKPEPEPATPPPPPPIAKIEPAPKPTPTPTRRHQKIPAQMTHASPPAAPGFLVLASDPWVTVYLGAARLGTTPLRVPLPAGRHELTLQLKDSSERRPLSVVIASGQEKRLALHLR